MASFDKGTGTSSSPPCPPTFTLAPKPIAAVAPLSSPLFFSEREGGRGRDDEEEEEGGPHLDLDLDEQGSEDDDDDQEEMVTNANTNTNLNANANWSLPGYEHALVIARPQPCFSRPFNPLHVSSSSSAQHDPLRPHNIGWPFSAQEATYWDVLRSHFSDPVTGALMDDAMILTCGHSFGRGGMQQVYLTKACCKCSQPISADLVRPNFALRTAVQAFRHEEEMHSWKASKRNRDQTEQEKCGYDDTYSNDFLRNRASLLPLAISDRVIIKGNKRTPPRFVGRVAVVTEQCINGWYVVKTLDNGESIKLQFGSLAKVSADQSTSVVPTRANYPNWL